jgi:hypothetical protein
MVWVLIIAIWAGVAVGFGGDIIHHVSSHAKPYPLIVHIHAIAFVGWLVLLTVQASLIRLRRPYIHRILGFAGIFLAVAMIILGPAAAYVVNRQEFGTPAADPSFIAVQLADIIGFGGLAAAAFLWRNQAAAHKRLILLSSLYIADAAYARFMGPLLGPTLGPDYGSQFLIAYGGNDLLILGLGLYDLITRRALNPAYLAGVLWITALQLGALATYQSGWWQPVALKLIGH